MRLAVQLPLRNKPNGWRTSYLYKANISAPALVTWDLANANEAFVKAVPANSDATARDLQRQGQIAKTLFSGVQQAFRSNH